MNGNHRGVPGAGLAYSVTDTGMVWSSYSMRYLSPSVDEQDRLRVDLSIDGVRRTRRVHHLVLEAFVGPRPDGLVARHLNGNHRDNRLLNLKWGTHSENTADQVLHGTHRQTQKTACPQGHNLSGRNLAAYALSQGQRTCRSCKQARQWAQRATGRNWKINADFRYAEFVGSESN